MMVTYLQSGWKSTDYFLSPQSPAILRSLWRSSQRHCLLLIERPPVSRSQVLESYPRRPARPSQSEVLRPNRTLKRSRRPRQSNRAARNRRTVNKARCELSHLARTVDSQASSKVTPSLTLRQPRPQTLRHRLHDSRDDPKTSRRSHRIRIPIVHSIAPRQVCSPTPCQPQLLINPSS